MSDIIDDNIHLFQIINQLIPIFVLATRECILIERALQRIPPHLNRFLNEGRSFVVLIILNGSGYFPAIFDGILIVELFSSFVGMFFFHCFFFFYGIVGRTWLRSSEYLQAEDRSSKMLLLSTSNLLERCVCRETNRHD